MMGGLSGGMEARSNKWDNSTIEALKKKRDKLEADMQQFGSIRELQMKESEAAEKKNGLERKIYYLDIEKTTIQEKLSKLEGEKEIVKKEIACLKPELQKLTSSIDERTEGIQKLEKRLNEIADRIFKDFSQSVGVKNIREHEENKLKAAQDIYERQLNLSNQISKLGYELDYEKKRDMVSPITKLAMSLKSLDEDLINTQKKDSDARLAVEEIDTQMEESKAKVDEWKGMSDECEEAIEELRKQVTSLKDTIGKLNRQINSKETRHEQLESYKWEVLEICKDQQISLPTIDDPMETGSSKPGRVFEYSQLNGSRLQDTSPSERGKLETEFKQKMGALIVEIEQTAPNLKALDQYEALQGKEKEVIEKFEAARKEEKEIADKYNAVRQRRYELFMEAFEHISKNIDKIYKQLTKSHTHPIGGTAYLNLENDDEPFLHGIKYTAMPPTKRFRDMEQLSGGEKTVAALALLFAIHSYRPSPFFILDEVDAALDNLNVAKVASFIRSRSCDGARVSQDAEGGHGFQSIVISLKDSFYDKAEALVGVYRDSERSCSRTLTFDLTKYRE